MSKLYEAKVLCEGIIPADIGIKRGKPKQSEHIQKTIIIEAETVDEAWIKAKDYADSNAETHCNWTAFTVLSVASVSLPMEVVNARIRFKRQTVKE